MSFDFSMLAITSRPPPQRAQVEKQLEGYTRGEPALEGEERRGGESEIVTGVEQLEGNELSS